MNLVFCGKYDSWEMEFIQNLKIFFKKWTCSIIIDQSAKYYF